MDNLKEIKKILNSKIIFRIDKSFLDKDKKIEEIIILFINPETKNNGHVVLNIDVEDKKFKKEFKKFLLCKFNKTIKGFKNWKKIIKNY